MDNRYPIATGARDLPHADAAAAHLDAVAAVVDAYTDHLSHLDRINIGLSMAQVRATLALAEATDAPLEVTTTHLPTYAEAGR